MIRTRFAPSPTGYMHIGNLRTALYEYLIAKKDGGTFILRIEDTDQNRLVDGSVDVIYKTLKLAGLNHDEGPDIGGDFGPYVQSERMDSYLTYAQKLVDENKAYYCFCDKERLDTLSDNELGIKSYDRHCYNLTKEEVLEKLNQNVPYVIRQLIPEGSTTFHDEVYGSITVENKEIDDQILIKSDKMPTYNFANVVDDHLMNITHVVRGSEYLSSTPKYNLLYDAFSWEIPTYIHLPLITDLTGKKLSKRNGDASFEDLIEEGFLPEAIINYIALLGWSPSNDEEIFSLEELIENFDVAHISKAPSAFDKVKLTWLNSEYIKKMDDEKFFELSKPYLEEAIKREDVDLFYISTLVKTRVSFVKDVGNLVQFIDNYGDYDLELFVHKKMKTTKELSKNSLIEILPVLENEQEFELDRLHDLIMDKINELGIKNGQMLWPLRTALTGEPTSPCGAIDLLVLLGKDESIKRIKSSIDRL